MATFSDLALEAAKLANDADSCDDTYNFTRWSENDMIHYAYDAILMLSSLMPKWFSKLKVVTLKPGRIQELPTDCSTLVKVIGVHNSVDAASPIAATVDDRLGGIFPSVCTGAVTSKDYKLRNYTIESGAKNIFYIDPPAPEGGPPVQLDVICSAAPVFDNDKEKREYQIPPWAHNAVIEWMLYRAYSSEDEATGSETNATMHRNHFYYIIDNYIKSEEYFVNKKVSRNGTAESV